MTLLNQDDTYILSLSCLGVQGHNMIWISPESPVSQIPQKKFSQESDKWAVAILFSEGRWKTSTYWKTKRAALVVYNTVLQRTVRQGTWTSKTQHKHWMVEKKWLHLPLCPANAMHPTLNESMWKLIEVPSVASSGHKCCPSPQSKSQRWQQPIQN